MSETQPQTAELMDLSKRIFGRKHAMTIMLELTNIAFEPAGLANMNTSDLQDRMQLVHGVSRATTHGELGRMEEMGMITSVQRYREVIHELQPGPAWDFISQVCELKLTPPATA